MLKQEYVAPYNEMSIATPFSFYCKMSISKENSCKNNIPVEVPYKSFSFFRIGENIQSRSHTASNGIRRSGERNSERNEIEARS